MTDLRKLTRSQMKRQKISIYRLGVEMEKREVCHKDTIYSWLNGGSGINSNYLPHIFDFVGIEVKRK